MDLTARQLEIYKTCPFKFYLIYRKGIKYIEVHATRYLENIIKTCMMKLFQRKTTSLDSILKLFHDLWKERPGDLILNKKKTSTSYEIKGELYLKNLYYKVKHLLDIKLNTNEKILGMNQPYLYPLLKHNIAGTIDLVTLEKTKDYVLTFFEFEDAIQPKEKLINNFKYTLGVLGFRNLFNITEKKVQIHYLKNNSIIDIENNDIKYIRIDEELKMLIKAISTNIYYPINNWKCNKCTFRKLCIKSKNLL